MQKWQKIWLIIATLFGLAVSVGIYTFMYAKGYAYLTNTSSACANCHVMNQQYDAWLKSSHRHVAQCNDCHASHDLIGKYKTKAVNGFWHSFAFTTGRFQEPIRITKVNREVTEGACRSCHTQIAESVDGHSSLSEQTECIRCHQSVGHPH